MSPHISGPDCQKWQAARGHTGGAVAGAAAEGDRQPEPPGPSHPVPAKTGRGRPGGRV